VRFYETILNVDPITAKIFGKIAEEEVEHIRLVERYYPHLPSAATKSLGSSSRLV
jgi:rubrerythrin